MADGPGIAVEYHRRRYLVSPDDHLLFPLNDEVQTQFEVLNGVNKDRLLGWRDVSRHPDPEDLGYEFDQWETVEAQKYDEDLLLFLPSDEELLKVDAFIVASPDAICDVENHV